MTQLLSSLASFGMNLAIVIVIVRFIYFPQQRNKRYVFTFFAFNTIVFFVMGLLDNSDISIGVGFGLFAIFSILRYRTDTIPIREMTYLFVLIALPVLNSILLLEKDYAEFAAANLAVILVLYVLEQGWGFSYEIHKSVAYERIEMIRPDKWEQLLADLMERTGLPITRIEIGRLDFVRDTAQIHIYYDAQVLEHTQVRYSATDSLVAEVE